MLQRYPGSKHFIIPHSHGGNVALYGLRDPDLRESIEGVATLSTPFVIVRPRNLGPNGGVLLLRLLALPGIGIGYLIQKIAKFHSPVSWLVSIAFGIISGYFLIFAERYLKRRRTELRQMVLPELDGLDLMILRVVADEARSALAFAEFVGLFAVKMWSCVSAPIEWVDHAFYGRNTVTSRRIQRIVLSLIVYNYLLLGLIALSEKVFHVPMDFARTILKWTGGAMTLTVFGTLALALLAGVPLLLLLMVLTPIGLLAGLGGPGAVLLLETTTESTPIGTWQIQQLSGPVPSLVEEATSADPALPQLSLAPQHGAAHSNTDALKVLTNWLRSRA